MAVASAALIEVGAVGLGTLVTMIASTSAVDVTGILGGRRPFGHRIAGHPARRRKAKQELGKKSAKCGVSS